jgi:trehalose 6-phosphate synthase
LGFKFEAFEQVLRSHPRWCGKLTFLQITPKSRSAIAEYAAMEQELDTLSGRINAEYGDALWTPIRFVTRAYTREQLAGMFRAARVGVVTPLRDGMNLVAKEFVAAQDIRNPGVLVLSEFAGAAAELKAALIVNPNDPEAVAAAIHCGLTMSKRERISRHKELLASLCRSDISQWGRRFIGRLLGVPESSRATIPLLAAE